LDALPCSGLITSDAPSITDTPTYPTITNETSLHFAEALWQAHQRKWLLAGLGKGRFPAFSSSLLSES
jgi:hypothetical protein